MNLLEDRLIRIVELRKQGRDSEAIGRELGVDADMVESCELYFIENLSNAQRNGKNILEDIAQEVGVSPSTVTVGLSFYDIPIEVRKTNMPQKNRKELIKMLAEAGINSVKEVGRRLGLSLSTVIVYAKDIGIKLIGKRNLNEERCYKNQEEVVLNIRKAIEDGAHALMDIEGMTGYSDVTIKKYAGKAGIELPKRRGGTGPKLRPELDELIKQGLPLEEIGKIIGVSKERARQLIDLKGKHKEYRERREEVTLLPKIEKEIEAEKEKKALQEIYLLLDRRTEEAARQEGWEYEKAVEYVNRSKLHRPGGRAERFNDLVEIFGRYREAKEKGERLSLYELGEGTIYPSVSVGKILEDVGLEPMHWKIKDRQITPQNKKEAIRKAVHVKMPVSDIGYFLGIPAYVVNHNMATWGILSERPKALEPIKNFGGVKGHNQLTYHLASEIFEGRHRCGFSREEISQVLGVNRCVVDYAFKHEGEIRKEIVEALRILYGDEKINMPYRKDKF